MKQKFSVDGMMCAACQASVERSVNSLKGVNFCSVSLLGKSMVVEYDENSLNNETIINKVNSVGYKASIFVNKSIKKEKEEEQKKLKVKRNKLIASIILLILFMLFSMVPMLPPIMKKIDAVPQSSLICLLNVTAQVVLLIPIIALNFHHFISGFKSLFKLHPNMDALVALGSSVSTIYGLYIYGRMIGYFIDSNAAEVMNCSMNIYFESAAMILVFISLGKYIEAKATTKTKSSINNLLSLLPETALIYKNEQEKEVLIEDICEDDIVIIKPGMVVPCDGVIVEGYGNLDESSITGEAIPVYKDKGKNVVASTINKDGYFKFKAEKIGKESTLGRIVSLVEEAANSKSSLSRLADKISLIFVPAVISISIITFTVWMVLSGCGYVGIKRPDVNLAIQVAVSVLAISCPCALGLATPVAVMVGTGLGAEEGLLIKSAQAFEALKEVDTFVFDKTGTLTTGKIEVDEVIYYGTTDKDLLSRIRAVEVHSEHPLSKAIVDYYDSIDVCKIEDNEFVNYPGQGVSGKNIIIGNKKLMEKYNVDISQATEDFSRYASQGKIVLFVADKDLKGLIILGDQLKEDSSKCVKSLQNAGKKVVILTGDDFLTANYFAKLLGVDEVFANVLPNQKEQIVSSLQEKGCKVAMIGDGINDAPALTKADVGIAIGAGTDVAIESSDIILVKNSPHDVYKAYELSTRIVRNIKENLLWAFMYNIILIPIAAGVLYPINVEPNWFVGNQNHLLLTPMIASIVMSLSSITVVLNALRLKIFKRRKD